MTLLLIVLLFGKWATLIPLSVLAAILVMVCYHMSEWQAFRALLRAPRMDVAVLLATFLLTVFLDLTVAVEIGMLMSVVIFMKRMTDATTVKQVSYELEREEKGEEESVKAKLDPRQVAVYELEGAFFFGVADRLRDTLSLGLNPPRAMILIVRHVLMIDASGIRTLNDLRKACRRAGTQLILVGIHAQPLFALENADLLVKFGMENILETLDEALDRARQLLIPS